MRVPTPKQMALLAALPVGSAVINPRRHQWRPLLNHGWVEPLSEQEAIDHGYNFSGVNSYLSPLRISPEGLRALAAALEKHGHADPVEPESCSEATWHARGRVLAGVAS